MAIYDARGKPMHLKIRREGQWQFRPRWIVMGAGLLAAALGLSVFWQNLTPEELAVLAPETGIASAAEMPAVVVVSRPVNEEAVPAGPAAPDWSVRYQVPEADDAGEDYFRDTLFIGDSITTGIPLYRAMSGAQTVAATGINPDTILTKPVIRDADGNLQTVLEAMSVLTPKKIFVQLGANGIAWIDKETFIERYRTLIEAIRAQHPDASLGVQSIFPVTKEKSLSENGAYANEKIDAYNNALMELCETEGIAYLNVAEAFKEADGALAPGASADGIHIGPRYYEIWARYLRTHPLPEADGAKPKEQGEAV